MIEIHVWQLVVLALMAVIGVVQSAMAIALTKPKHTPSDWRKAPLPPEAPDGFQWVLVPKPDR